MALTRANFNELTEADLEDLVTAGAPEGLQLEYKREAYGNAEADKKEALKDITSFANSAGGHLIIGVDEEDGAPTKLVGLPDGEIDALIGRLENLARDGVEPRIVGIQMRRVDRSHGGAAVVVRIPRSWNPPHRVKTGNSNRFYLRNSSGVHEASVEELRVIFTASAQAQDRAKAFQLDRISKIQGGLTPVLLPGKGRLIIHVVPLAAFGQVDLEEAYRLHIQFRPLGAEYGMTPHFNVDGFVNLRGGEVCHGYTQVFRTGAVEATKANILSEYKDGLIVHAGSVANQIIAALPGYFEGLRLLEVPPPLLLMVALEGVVDARFGIWGYDNKLERINPFPRLDPLILPEAVVEDYGSPETYISAVRPVLDALWNTAGLARCAYFDADGNWKSPH